MAYCGQSFCGITGQTWPPYPTGAVVVPWSPSTHTVSSPGSSTPGAPSYADSAVSTDTGISSIPNDSSLGGVAPTLSPTMSVGADTTISTSLTSTPSASTPVPTSTPTDESSNTAGTETPPVPNSSSGSDVSPIPTLAPSGSTPTSLPATQPTTAPSTSANPTAGSLASTSHHNHAGAITGGVIGGVLGLLLLIGLAFCIRRRMRTRTRRLAPSAEFMAATARPVSTAEVRPPLARQMSIEGVEEAPPPFTPGTYSDPVFEKVRAAAVQRESYQRYSSVGEKSENVGYLDDKAGYLE
ncbi:hypothetical protein B0H21DRAFT_276076 [Amylocystis lapponica]|nr:hypothetical protein B0H21DRAFT_276076 [Amylocystis lapponica]